jgi:hypothetical protein
MEFVRIVVNNDNDKQFKISDKELARLKKEEFNFVEIKTDFGLALQCQNRKDYKVRLLEYLEEKEKSDYNCIWNEISTHFSLIELKRTEDGDYKVYLDNDKPYDPSLVRQTLQEISKAFEVVIY